MLNAVKKTNKLKIEIYKLIGLLRIYTFLFGDFLRTTILQFYQFNYVRTRRTCIEDVMSNYSRSKLNRTAN